jgi:hypothetical protein
MSRTGSDEAYVLDLCDEVLGAPGMRQHRFDWLLGDPNSAGRCTRLPVDGYWPDHDLVVEYHERQHREADAHIHKPDRLTVRELIRGRVYQEVQDFNLKRSAAPYRGLVQPSAEEVAVNGPPKAGKARPIDWHKQVAVALEDGKEETIEAKNIILATGSKPKSLPMLKIDGDRVWSSDHAVFAAEDWARRRARRFITAR